MEKLFYFIEITLLWFSGLFSSVFLCFCLAVIRDQGKYFDLFDNIFVSLFLLFIVGIHCLIFRFVFKFYERCIKRKMLVTVISECIDSSIVFLMVWMAFYGFDSWYWITLVCVLLCFLVAYYVQCALVLYKTL